MKGKWKAVIGIILTAIISCGLMAVVDGVIMPGYAVKSAIKMLLFLLLPFLLSRIQREVKFGELFRIRKNGIAVPLLLGLGIYAVIVGAYALLRNVFDFSGIAGSLSENAGVDGNNFLFVAIYISFVNSLLEEFFFRGFLFANLKEMLSRRIAYLSSALTFALYHVAMMIGWFSLPLFLLCMIGLTAGGMIFNYMNEKQGSIYASWLVHMFANFAINTIGFILLK